MPDITIEPPISFAKVAEMFQVSPQTVAKWRKRRDRALDAVKVGGGWYTTASAIRRFSGIESTGNQVSQDPNYERAVQQMRERHGI